MIARLKLPPELENLSRTELERVIYEAALHEDDEYIAREHLIKKRAQIDVAADLLLQRNTVGVRVAEIIKTLQKMADHLGLT